MPADTPKYEFTASNAQEAENLLNAASKLLDAHLLALAPNDSMIRAELRRRTPVSMTITLDLGDIARTISEVAALNEQMQTPSADSKSE